MKKIKEITIEIVKENVKDIPEEDLTKMKNNREEFAKLFVDLYNDMKEINNNGR